MSEHTVEVTPDEFEQALRVWLRCAPKSIVSRYLRWLKLAEQKRQSQEDAVDLPCEYAAVACAKMKQAGWIVMRRPIEHPAGRPKPRGDQ